VSANGPNQILPTTLGPRQSAPCLDVIFVHGLSGDRKTTWTADCGAFWPLWIAEDFPDCDVYVAGYISSAFSKALTGSGPSIQDLATTLVDNILSLPPRADKLLLITHSLGGLVVKQMIRRCNESGDPRFQGVLQKIKGVVFLATPHQGAHLATALDSILKSFKSTAVQQLSYNNNELLELNTFFSNFAVKNGLVIRPYYETDKTNGIHVVDRITANPNIFGAEPIAVQADHLGICKPSSKEASLYLSISELLRSILNSEERNSLSSIPNPPISLPLATPRTGEPLKIEETKLEAESEHILTPIGVAPDILEDYAYFTTVAADDRRDIEKKLRDAGRDYQVKDAKKRKERFSMSLRRHIAQPAAVTRYMQILADVESRHSRHVRLVLSQGGSLAEVDEVIQKSVLDPCLERFSRAGEEISSAIVDNALYYLAGNCHVSWDNE